MTTNVRSPELVNIEPATYLVMEGTGTPEGARFQAAVKAVYSVAYTVKMQLRLEGQDIKIGPLEALWWTDDKVAFDALPDSSTWHWKVLLRMPDGIDAQLVELVRDSLVARRHLEDAADVRLEEISEGPCVQAVHVGPYSTEPETLALMHALMVESHMQPAGPHHEIYLNDPRRTRPERIRTILRQPVA